MPTTYLPSTSRPPSAGYVETLESVARGFQSRVPFRAVRRVDSEALFTDRRLCEPGDFIVVRKWYCFNGPTDVEIWSERPVLRTCIPFGWVRQMGAPKDLDAYMPFASRTWAEIIEHERKKLRWWTSRRLMSGAQTEVGRSAVDRSPRSAILGRSNK